ncbi:MAG: methionine adenosyltransferase [Bdellovibrionota bacterium]
MSRDRHHIFSSESVTEGHPDKIADQISDAVLDKILEQDPASRVACETMVATGMAIIAGEITTTAYVHLPDVVRKTLEIIGYNSSDMGFDHETCAVLSSIGRQSDDIDLGVSEGKGLFKEMGAGDQGLMFGFACRETKEFMPAPIYYSHALTRKLAEVRKNNTLNFLRPDGKAQLSFEYINGKPTRIRTVVVSTQHSAAVTHDQLTEAVKEEVIKKALPEEFLDQETRYFINPTGRFLTGGPKGDCGLTGRKIIVDTYGGSAPHGGGAFSGKDPTKVDRSAAYMARYIAKNVVASRAADRCTLQLAYAIGVAEPVSVNVECDGTEKVELEKIENAIREIFKLKPADIIQSLDLRKPIYFKTASYGHFGRNDVSWEKTDRVDDLRKILKV